MPVKIPENPRILVTRTDRIGDLVLTTPVFKALRERFPKAWIAALVFAEHEDLVRGNPNLDEVILYHKKTSEKSWWGQFCLARKLRRKNFDIVIHCHGTNRMHLAGWLAGIPSRIGYDRRAPWALTWVHSYNKKEGKKQEAEYLFDLLAPLGISAPDKIETFFPVTAEAEHAVEGVLSKNRIPVDKPWVLLNASASDQTKMWPAERFGELVTRMNAERPFSFIAIGTARDRVIIECVQKSTTVSVHDLSGQLTLGMLGALLKKAKLLVSNDSGPVHIAVAVGTPVVSIFGRYEPGLGPDRWRPLGEKARVVMKDVSEVAPEERKFTYIHEITVDEVCRAVKQLL